jgi:hypothetical protein
MSKLSAQDKRYAAIKLVSESNYPTIEAMTAAGIEAVAREIEAIASLGRTDRWREAVAYWAAMVRDESNPRAWALLQGSISCAHAA